MAEKINLNTLCYTLDEVAFILNESSGNKEWDARKVRNKFKKILEQLRFSNEDIKTIFRSGNLEKGEYIFKECDKESFLRLIKTDCELMTMCDRDFLIETLVRMMPVYKSVRDYNLIIEDEERKKDINQEMKSSNKETDRNQEIEDSNEKIDSNAKKIIINRQFENEPRIREIIHNYYNHSRNVKIFEKKIFVKKPEYGLENKSDNYGFFQYQYECVYEWENKWSTFMANIENLRIVERFDIGYDFGFKKELGDKWQQFCLTGKLENKRLQEEYDNRKESVEDVFEYVLDFDIKNDNSPEKPQKKVRKGSLCLDECCKLIESVLDAPLKKTAMEDYYYAIGQAFDELELIRQKVLHKEKHMHYKMMMDKIEKDADEQVWEELRNMRTKSSTKRISMI